MEEMVKRLRALCRARNTSFTKLEEQFGWGNGTIGKWKGAKNAPPADKLQLVANALKVSVDYILTGDDQQKKPAPESGPESKTAKLYDLANSLDDRDLSLLIKMAEEMAGQREQNN